jgi:CRISPR-associated protein Cas5d
MMTYTDKEFCLEVQGPMACFTRPELKVERVSYDVITPSAVRAIFEAIFWKPAIRWEPTRIEVLSPIAWMSVRRNEVGALANVRSGSVYIEEKRQQRNALMLRDVHYRIYAKLLFIPRRDRVYDPAKHPDIDALEADLLRQDENPGKYNAMFERRASKGQCFYQPYLGTRECSADFKLIADPAQSPAQPIAETRDLGIMLYDMDFSDGNNIQPMFFRAKMEQGVIVIPPKDSKEILR